LPRVLERAAFKAVDSAALQLSRRLQRYSVCHDTALPVPKAQAEELALRFFDRLKVRCGPTHT
jgi:hypothetical protein